MMAIPANLTSVVLRGTFITPEGDPSTGTISFTPSSWLINSGANVSIPNSAITKTLGTAGDFEVTLPVTDDPDLSPGDWVYSVSEVVDGVSQNYNILLPGTVGGTAYLADIAPAAAAGPEYYSLASSLTIGTVTTLAEGASATADITGLAPTQVLDLGIPVGATGTVASAGSGSVGTAAIAAAGDPNTGIYFPAADQVAITTGGTAAATFAAGAIANPTFSGVASFPDGSASDPSVTNDGDTNTGLFFPAADTVAVTTGGTERVRVTSAGSLGLGTTVADKLAHLKGSSPVIRIEDTGAKRTALDILVANDEVRFQQTAYTTASGTNMTFFVSNTERMRLDPNGLITGTGTSLGAWTAYTPSLTNFTLGNGTMTGVYCQIGKVVMVRLRFTAGSTSTFSGRMDISLPVTANGSNIPNGTILATDASTGTNYVGTTRSISTTVVSAWFSGATASAMNDTSPFTWTTDDTFFMTFTYEAA